MVDQQEQDKVDAFNRRMNRVKNFMEKMEAGVIQEENKKAKFLEDTIERYTNQKEIEKIREDERRRNKIENDKLMLRKVLRDQIEEKNAFGKLDKYRNTEFNKFISDQTEKEQNYEKFKQDTLKQKQMAVQDAIL